MKTFCQTIFLLLSCLTIQAQEIDESYSRHTYENDGKVLNYRMLLPNDFDKSNAYPVVLFLHGMGERGTDNNTQLAHGARMFLDSIQKYPAIVIFPQCPPTDYWANLYRPDTGGASRKFTFHTEEEPHPTLGLVIDLIDSLLQEPFTDTQRLYVSGLSMGAFGVWELLWRIPDKIAAAIPICGGGPVEMASEMTSVPIWAFHGTKDDVVHPRLSALMVKSIQQQGGQAKITLLVGANHNAWDPAFADPEYLKWLFSHIKTNLK